MFLLSEIVSLILSAIFIYIGRVITKNLLEVIESLTSKAKIVDRMKTSMQNMWIIIIVLTVINIYSFIYSLFLWLKYPSSPCHSSNVHVYNTSTIMNRLITYIIWVVPIIIIFWPSNLTLWCTRKIKVQEKNKEYEYAPSTLVED